MTTTEQRIPTLTLTTDEGVLAGPVVVWPEGYRPLPTHLKADRVLTRGQKLLMVVGASLLLALVGFSLAARHPAVIMAFVQIIVDVVTLLNFAIIAYKGVLFLRGLRYRPVRLDNDALRMPPKGGWPMMNVIVPLFHEPPALIHQLVKHLSALQYPQEALKVLLAVEHDDLPTIEALRQMTLPESYTVVVCPPRDPVGKPGACRHALLTTGALKGLTVIYDAEDIPDPLQLAKAAHAFAKLPPRVVCLQAQLQYHNVGTNILTKWFASEYAMHFSFMLVGLSVAGSPIPLGGTSNFFRTDALLELGSWDVHNVTEDATLGIAIARRGWQVQMLDSVTLEEANRHVGNWIRQRSRWIKGYAQTYLVHMRNPWRLWRELGTRGFWSFQFVLGYATFTTVVNPLLWALTGLYFVGRLEDWSTVTQGIEHLFPAPVFYLGLLSMMVGNLLVVYFHLAGCMERRLHGAVLSLVLLPVYWVLMFVAACLAFIELLHTRKRFTWSHTRHGLDAAPESFEAHSF